MKSISNAKKGAIATGGGYSPFVKMAKNSWKQKKTNTKSHDDGIFDKIGMFKDFKINEAKAEDVLKKYVKNPYGIGANRVNDEGKYYSLLFSDSHSREETIKKLRSKGILAKKMRKMMQPKSMEYRYELILHKESINEKIERGNEVHAETKKELKDAIAKSMKEILAGKTPKYDIINGMSGEMIGWKDGNDYVWQPNAIPYAERELK